MATGRRAPEPNAGYGPELHRFLSRWAKNPSDVKELSQEVYARFVIATKTEPPLNPRAFLYAIATNVASEFRRKVRRCPITTDSEVAQNVSEFPLELPRNDPCIGLEAISELNMQFRSLPKTHRAVLLLTRGEGLTFQEVATRLGLSVHTVKKYQTESLTQIRQSQMAKELS